MSGCFVDFTSKRRRPRAETGANRHLLRHVRYSITARMSSSRKSSSSRVPNLKVSPA